MARKTAFVNEMILKTLNQHQQTVPPNIKEAATLDEEIGNVLKRNDVTDYDKAKLYSQILQKYLMVKDKITQVPVTSPVITEQKTKSLPYGHDAIVDTIPKKYKSRAMKMLQFIHQNEAIRWDERGQVLLNNTIIPGSNITDLINDQVRNRKNVNPEGWKQFSEALKLMNVPTELIGNKRRHNITSEALVSPVSKTRKSVRRKHPYTTNIRGNWITKLNG